MVRQTLAASVCTALIAATAATAADGVKAKRGYVDTRYGQTHYYSFEPTTGPGKKTPIAFFHQNPKSAYEYEPLTSELGKDRLVLAFDTPGYGMSDRPASAPSMNDIAGSMADALAQLGYGKNKRQVDVFGFHTGTYIAAELAIERPDLVRRVVLSGVPYYDAKLRQARLDALPTTAGIPEDASFVVRRWHEVVTTRSPGVPIERAAKIFLDDIRSLDKAWYAYNAVWTFNPDERLPKITQPILIVQPPESLTEPTRAAHRTVLSKATMVEFSDVTKNVFDLIPQEYAKHMRAWLDK